MLLTDTDSFYHIVETENVSKDSYKNMELFYFGNYPEESKYYNRNNLVVGKMKDETCGVPIKSFVGLK